MIYWRIIPQTPSRFSPHKPRLQTIISLPAGTLNENLWSTYCILRINENESDII